MLHTIAAGPATETKMTKRPSVSGNAARNVAGKAFDFEYSAEDTPNVVDNTADRIHEGGSAFTGRIVSTGTLVRSKVPWWKAPLLWLIKTTVGKAIGVGVSLIIITALGLKSGGFL